MIFKPFEDLFEIPLRNGLTKPKVVRGEGYKMVNMGELFAVPRMINIPMDRVPLLPRELETSLLEHGDLLFARQSLVRDGAGQCSIFLFDDEKVCFESHLIRCRLDKEIANPLFYYYFFRSSIGKQTIDAIIEQGAGAAGIRGSDLAKISVPYVDKTIQDTIAEQLSAIDDKIELNRQINRTLEQIAQTIFKSWFVDFEPVKAKIEGKAAGRDPERAAMCAISGKCESELDQLPSEQHQQLAATAALFTDEQVESELGLIPEGWEVKSITDVSTFASGKVDVSALSLENYISTENMLENKGGVSSAASLPTVATVPSFSKGQVLISNIRPYFKKIWLARFAGGRSNDVLAFNARERDCTEFLYNLLYQDDFFEFMMRTSKGAKMPRGDKDAIAGWKFPCANHELRSFFSGKVRPYYSYIESLNAEVHQLSLTRDCLLPKLLSGEIKINEVVNGD